MIQKFKYMLALLGILTAQQAYAQQPASVWITDFVKVKNGHRSEMLYYFEQNWKAYRDTALARGFISGYELLETSPDSSGGFDFILLTTFPDSAAYAAVEANFAPIMKAISPNGPKLLNNIKPGDFRAFPYSKEAKAIFSAQAKRVPDVHIATDAEHIARLKEINHDIWESFSEAYSTNNAALYIGLHAPDFIRATSGQKPEVRNLSQYSEDVKISMSRRAAQSRRAEIHFTFFERAASPETASERGIYRYTDITNTGQKKYYYGKFHVFHRKINGKWKIAVDYDSDEDGTIDDSDFKAGLPPDVFSK